MTGKVNVILIITIQNDFGYVKSVDDIYNGVFIFSYYVASNYSTKYVNNVKFKTSPVYFFLVS